jgi:[acyl-carrier-protein] S-malonyltransferase
MMSVAFGMMFPGQGSQSVGMLDSLGQAHGVVRETFAEASDAIGVDLWALAQQGPAEDLDRTFNTQPVLLTASVAVYRAWREAGGPAPAIAAGHSLGECSALVAAEALSLVDGVRLVRERGRLMQDAVPEGQGAMAAILGLDDVTVERCCEDAAGEGIVSAANYNAPGQVVIAGDTAAIDRAIAACKSAGAKRAMALRVSGPFHCALMAPAAAAFSKVLETCALQTPVFPVIHSVDATLAADPAGMRERLVRQVHAPVRWSQCVRSMASAGVSLLVECGPGRILSGLVKRIDRGLGTAATTSEDAFAEALAAVH